MERALLSFLLYSCSPYHLDYNGELLNNDNLMYKLRRVKYKAAEFLNVTGFYCILCSTFLSPTTFSSSCWSVSISDTKTNIIHPKTSRPACQRWKQTHVNWNIQTAINDIPSSLMIIHICSLMHKHTLTNTHLHTQDMWPPVIKAEEIKRGLYFLRFQLGFIILCVQSRSEMVPGS